MTNKETIAKLNSILEIYNYMCPSGILDTEKEAMQQAIKYINAYEELIEFMHYALTRDLRFPTEVELLKMHINSLLNKQKEELPWPFGK